MPLHVCGHVMPILIHIILGGWIVNKRSVKVWAVYYHSSSHPHCIHQLHEQITTFGCAILFCVFSRHKVEHASEPIIILWTLTVWYVWYERLSNTLTAIISTSGSVEWQSEGRWKFWVKNWNRRLETLASFLLLPARVWGNTWMNR